MTKWETFDGVRQSIGDNTMLDELRAFYDMDELEAFIEFLISEYELEEIL